MAETGQTVKAGYVAQLFREVRTLKGLMIRPEERSWLEKPPEHPQSRAVVLYLGCNVLRTPHLAQTVVDVFQHLGEDFVALGGPAFCCGVPFQYEGATGDARRWGEKLLSHFQRFQPRWVVMWCPGCLNFYEQVMALSYSFRLMHVTEFLAENKDRLSFASQSAAKVALHYHSGSTDVERQAAAARDLLASVPGLELLEIGSSDAWGRGCSGNVRDRLGREAWEALIIPFFRKAADSGADVFATLYHGCHRMYAGDQDRFLFTIEHYLTVIARALDIAYPDKYKEYLLWKDRDRILKDARPCMEANQVRPEHAGSLIERVFVDGTGF